MIFCLLLLCRHFVFDNCFLCTTGKEKLDEMREAARDYIKKNEARYQELANILLDRPDFLVDGEKILNSTQQQQLFRSGHSRNLSTSEGISNLFSPSSPPQISSLSSSSSSLSPPSPTSDFVAAFPPEDPLRSTSPPPIIATPSPVPVGTSVSAPIAIPVATTQASLVPPASSPVLKTRLSGEFKRISKSSFTQTEGTV